MHAYMYYVQYLCEGWLSGQQSDAHLGCSQKFKLAFNLIHFGIAIDLSVHGCDMNT